MYSTSFREENKACYTMDYLLVLFVAFNVMRSKNYGTVIIKTSKCVNKIRYRMQWGQVLYSLRSEL